MIIRCGQRKRKVTVLHRIVNFVGLWFLLFVFLLSASLNLAAQSPRSESCQQEVLKKAVTFELSQGTNIQYAISQQLYTGQTSPIRGLKAFVDPEQGNCLACHKSTKIENKIDPKNTQTLHKYGFQGNIGSSLDGVASRYSIAELRLILVDSRTLFPNTIMPSYYKTEAQQDVVPECQGQTILSAQQIEDILAFMSTLK